jgi:hypothetical protein
MKANYGNSPEDIIFDTTSFLLNFNELGSPICRFFDWTMPKPLGNLNVLANEVLKCAMNTGHEAFVRLLTVRDDVDVNIKASNKTPSWWAAKNGHEAVVKLPLETGQVDVNSEGSRDGPRRCHGLRWAGTSRSPSSYAFFVYS